MSGFLPLQYYLQICCVCDRGELELTLQASSQPAGLLWVEGIFRSIAGKVALNELGMGVKDIKAYKNALKKLFHECEMTM